MGAVDLAVDVAGVNEEDGVGARCALLAFIQKPQRARQRDGVEHVRADGDHHVHGTGFDQLLADFLFAATCITGGIRHDESGAAFCIQAGIEQLYPQHVGVVGARHAEGKAAACAHVRGQPVLIHGVDVERRIGEDEIEFADGFVRVVVVAVDVSAVADVAFKAVDGEVHARQASGVVGLFHAVDEQFVGGIFLVLGHEARALHEHAAGAAGGIEDAPVKRLDHFDQQAHDGAGRVELAALLPFGAGEFAEEVFVDATEGIVVKADGNLGDFLQQLLEQGAGENLKGARQHARQLRVVLLDFRHRVVDGLPDVGAFRQIQQMIEARRWRQEDHAFGMVGGGIVGAVGSTAGRCPGGFQLRAALCEASLGKQQENQAQHRRGILRRRQPGIGAELVGGIPQALFKCIGSGIPLGWCNPVHAFFPVLRIV